MNTSEDEDNKYMMGLKDPPPREPRKPSNITMYIVLMLSGVGMAGLIAVYFYALSMKGICQ